MGMTEDRFWISTAREVIPYVEAEKIRFRKIDRDNHNAGIYMYYAVSTAIENVFNGKKAKAEYLKEPLSQSQKEKQELSDEEKRKYTKQFFGQLEIMQMNFEMNKKTLANMK